MNEEWVQKTIEEAKALGIKKYEPTGKTLRKWLSATVDSYQQKDNRVEIIVLEGSPAKAVIYANYGIAEVILFGVDGRKIHTWVR
jgi:hypothetical protein